MGPTRRAFLAGVATLPLCGLAAAAARGGFADFVESLWPAAQAQGVTRAAFDAATSGLTADPSLTGMGQKQPEFERTIKAYLDGAVTGGRVTGGRTMLARYGGVLAQVERRYGVPAPLVVALWAVETDFGRAMGNRDVLRSLATLAWSRGEANFADECVAALVMIARGDATRETLRGSWAGAMGHPQFLPSAYLKYAVAYEGGHAPDIWTSVPDALASIAHFMREEGWKAGLPWGAEVVVPAGFDWRALTGDAAAFAARGFVRADGGTLRLSGPATLYLPAGARGPAFLLSDNYWIIKQYNNSDSYAMAVALLADRIAGGSPVRAAWPADFRLLAPADRVRLQTLLRARGYYKGKIDGRFGPAGRDAIHRFQVDAGILPADGFASSAVLAQISGRS